jgi:hypothetical protein
VQFPGANVLANHLSPTSLEYRKKALAHSLATQGATNLSLGAGVGDAHGSAPGLSFNPFMTGYLQALSHGDPAGSSVFFQDNLHGGSAGGDPSGPPTRNLFDPRQSAPPTLPTPPGSNQFTGQITGGFNPYLGFDPSTIQALAANLRSTNTFQAV